MSSNDRQYWIDRVLYIDGGLALLTSPSPQKEADIFPLLDLEAKFCSHPQHGKIMASLVDLKLTWFFTDSDFFTASHVYQDKLHFMRLPSHSHDEIAASRITFLNHANSFVLRCRAYWDKLMGLLVLVFKSDRYKQFEKAESRKETFQSIANSFLTPESIRSLMDLLELLNRHRTPEAHATGCLRNWTLKDWDENPIKTPYADLVTLRNRSHNYTLNIISLIMQDGASLPIDPKACHLRE